MRRFYEKRSKRHKHICWCRPHRSNRSTSAYVAEDELPERQRGFKSKFGRGVPGLPSGNAEFAQIVVDRGDISGSTPSPIRGPRHTRRSEGRNWLTRPSSFHLLLIVTPTDFGILPKSSLPSCLPIVAPTNFGILLESSLPPFLLIVTSTDFWILLIRYLHSPYSPHRDSYEFRDFTKSPHSGKGVNWLDCLFRTITVT